MRIFVLIAFFAISLKTAGQEEWKTAKGFSFYIGYSTLKVTQGGVGYVRNGNNYSVGISSQRGEQEGKEVAERLDNYGNTVIGSGYYFEGGDFTYERSITNTVTIGAIATVGSEKHFVNYRDGRFTGDGYHFVDSKKTKGGFGAQAAYFIKGLIGFSLGYHSIYKATMKIQVRITN